MLFARLPDLMKATGCGAYRFGDRLPVGNSLRQRFGSRILPQPLGPRFEGGRLGRQLHGLSCLELLVRRFPDPPAAVATKRHRPPNDGPRAADGPAASEPKSKYTARHNGPSRGSELALCRCCRHLDRPASARASAICERSIQSQRQLPRSLSRTDASPPASSNVTQPSPSCCRRNALKSAFSATAPS